MEQTLVRTDSSVASTSQTQVVSPDQVGSISPVPVLRLRLKKPKNDKKVAWREDTVDNEGMGKKKSKCCCIYKKPTVFGESSSESEDECENCFGHPEVKKQHRHHSDHPDDDSGSSGKEPLCPN